MGSPRKKNDGVRRRRKSQISREIADIPSARYLPAAWSRAERPATSWATLDDAHRRSPPMNRDHCLLERDGHVLTVTLNRPEAKNALSPGMLAGMYRAWRMLDDDPELRVAILTGRGDVFCAGADLKAMGAGEDRKSTRLNSSHLGISYA